MQKVILTEKGQLFRKELFQRVFSEEVPMHTSNNQNIPTSKPKFLTKKGKPSKLLLLKDGHKKFKNYESREITKLHSILSSSRKQKISAASTPDINHFRISKEKTKSQQLDQFDSFTGKFNEFQYQNIKPTIHIQRKSIRYELTLAKFKLENKILKNDVYNSMSSVLNLSKNKKRDSIFRKNNFKFESFKEMNHIQEIAIKEQIRKKMLEAYQARDQPMHLVNQFLRVLQSEEKDLEQIVDCFLLPYQFKLSETCDRRFANRIKQLHDKKYAYFWKDNNHPGKQKKENLPEEGDIRKHGNFSQSNLSQLINQSQNEDISQIKSD